MRGPPVPRLLAVLGLTALLLGSAGVLAPASAPAASLPRAPSVLQPVGVGTPTPVAGASELQAASASLAAGHGPGVVPAAPPGGTRSAFSLWPTTSALSSARHRPSADGGWNLLGVPAGYSLGAMAYDASDGSVVEFGGIPGTGSTWTFANGTWTNITGPLTVSPAPRAGASMVYDASLGKIVLFGGFGEDHSVAPEALNDTWTFHAGTWTNVTGSAGAAPPGRFLGGFAYDPNDSADVLYGGEQQHGVGNDTWEFAGGRWTNVTGNQTVTPYVGGPPDLAEDGTDGDVVMVGGGNASFGFGNQTWTFAGNHWSNVTSHVGSAPPPRAGQVLATDSTGGGVVLFGGYGANATLPPGLTDTWRFVHGHWSRISAGRPTPGPREEEMWSDDPGASGLLLTGGFDEFNLTEYTDTWTFSAGGWTLLGAGSSPNPRSATEMAYDSTSDQVLLFGGSGLNDTWSYAHATWTELHPPRSPPGRLAATLANDPSDGGLVLFGGEALTGGATGFTVYNDTWVWANGTWTNLTATAGGPPARILAASVYDSTAGVVVLYGGSSFGGFHDTWTFHSGRWTAVNTTGPVPEAVEDVGFADDPADSGVLLFGGYGTGGQCTHFGNECNQTWTFANGTWTNRTVPSAPSSRESPGLVYDPSLRAEVLYGGFGAECHSLGPNASECTTALENDTWSYSGGHWKNLTSTLGPPPESGVGYAMVADAADGYLFLYGAFDGEYGNVGSGYWWSLTTGATSGPLTVGTPTASANPDAVGHSTLLAVAVSGGLAPYAISWNGLPTGCASSNATGLVCSPSQADGYLVTVHVTDDLGNSVTSAPLSLNITATTPDLGSVAISPATPSVAIGATISLSAEAFDTSDQSLSGATFAWSLLPSDRATLNASAGPTVAFTAGTSAGTVAVQASATWDGSTVDGGGTVTIFEATGAPLTVGSFSVSPTSVEVGLAAVFATLASGGTEPYSYAYTDLPTGCSSGNVANLSCSPSATGTYVVEVHVTDFAGGVRTANASLTVNPGICMGCMAPVVSGGLSTIEWVALGGVVVVLLVVATVAIVRGRRPPPTPLDPPT